MAWMPSFEPLLRSCHIGSSAFFVGGFGRAFWALADEGFVAQSESCALSRFPVPDSVSFSERARPEWLRAWQGSEATEGHSGRARFRRSGIGPGRFRGSEGDRTGDCSESEDRAGGCLPAALGEQAPPLIPQPKFGNSSNAAWLQNSLTERLVAGQGNLNLRGSGS